MKVDDTKPVAGRWQAIRPLFNRDYRLLILAVAIAIFATGMWTIVMVFQVLAIENRPSALSVVAACLSGALLAFLIPGGLAADRYPRRKILLGVQLLNAIAVACVAILALAGNIQLWHMALASAALGIGSAFIYPAYSALLPQVLPAEELFAANGLEGALRPTMQQGLGPGVGGALVGYYSPAVGAVVVAALFLLAFLVLLFLTRKYDVRVRKDQSPPHVWLDLRHGVTFVIRTNWLLWTLLFASLQTLVIMGPIEVLLPFIARDSFEDGPRAFGLLLAIFGIGGAIGSLVTSSFPLPRRYLTVMMTAWAAGTMPLMIVGGTDSFWVMAAALFIVGAASGAGMVIWGTLLQVRVPGHMLGRVASLDFFVTIVFMPLSIVLVGLLAETIPTPVFFLAAGVIPAVLGAAAIVLGRMPQDEIENPLTI